MHASIRKKPAISGSWGDKVAEGQAGEIDRLQDLGDAQQYNINVDHGARAVVRQSAVCVHVPAHGRLHESCNLCDSTFSRADHQGARKTSLRSSMIHSNLHHTFESAGQSSQYIDRLFTGNILGHKSDIASGELRIREFRTYNNIEGDYYIAQRFLHKIAMHMVKNYLWEKLRGVKVPLILGIWGAPVCGVAAPVPIVARHKRMFCRVHRAHVPTLPFACERCHQHKKHQKHILLFWYTL